MVHTVHLFLTERMSSAKRGPPPPFPLFVRGVLEATAHAARIAKNTAMYFLGGFLFDFFSPETITEDKIKLKKTPKNRHEQRLRVLWRLVSLFRPALPGSWACRR